MKKLKINKKRKNRRVSARTRKRFRVKVIFTFIAIAVLAAGTALFLYVRNAREAGKATEPRKIQRELYEYDNWAVYAESSGGGVIDERVKVYADKMLEEAVIAGTDFTVVSEYDLGLRLEFFGSENNEWFRRNSWRFGFIYRDFHDERTGRAGDYRFVGVFPAEQMYYSGLSLYEYRIEITSAD